MSDNHMRQHEGNPEHIAKLREIIAQVGGAARVGESIPQLSAEERVGELIFVGTDQWREWREELGEPPDLSGADFSDVVIPSLDFSNAKMVGTDFGDSILLFCKFENADLRKANFSRSKLWLGPSFKGADLSDATFAEAELEAPQADEKTRLTRTDFSDCKIEVCSDGSGREWIENFRGCLSEAQRQQLDSKQLDSKKWWQFWK